MPILIGQSVLVTVAIVGASQLHDDVIVSQYPLKSVATDSVRWSNPGAACSYAF